MCKETLFRIYELSLSSGGAKNQVIEQILEWAHSEVLTIDDERNEPEMYAHLFGNECRATLETVLLGLMRGTKELTFKQARDHLQALSFLQALIAKALWKYRQEVGLNLEEFARDFDRLDVEHERMRLFEYAQSIGRQGQF
jgi:hypothetical protein